MGSDSALAKALRNFLLGFRDVPPDEWVLVSRRPTGGVNAEFTLQVDLDSAFEKILEALPEATPIKTPGDVFECVIPLLNAAAPLELIAARLQDPPLTRFPFAVPISGPSGVGLEGEIGGEDSLEVVARPVAPEGFHIIELRGVVADIGVRSVVERVESHVLSLIPMAAALGLAGIGTTRIGPVDLVIEGERFALDARIGALAAATRFGLVNDPENEIDQVRFERSEFDDLIGPRWEHLRHTIVDLAPRSIALRSAARLLGEAESSLDAGRSVSFALMSLEAALLDPKSKSDILARIKEAVAYRLARSHDERVQLRKEIEGLYETRSRYVHAGSVAPNRRNDRFRALVIARRALRLEILGS